jgi:hypothetical protein
MNDQGPFLAGVFQGQSPYAQPPMNAGQSRPPSFCTQLEKAVTRRFPPPLPPLNQPSVPSSQIQASLLTLLKKCDSIGQQYLIQKRRAQIILAVILSVFALCAIGSVSDYSENASCSPTPTTLSSQVARFFPRLLKFPIKSRVSCSVIKRLRLDFPLITNGEIEGQFWWIVTSEQRDEVLDFARRNRLKLVEG